jgi:hypothetical protein
MKTYPVEYPQRVIDLTRPTGGCAARTEMGRMPSKAFVIR